MEAHAAALATGVPDQTEVQAGPIDELKPKRTRKPSESVKCHQCGKTFTGAKMRSKLGAHRYQVHGKGAAKVAKGEGAAPDVSAVFAPLRAAAIDVKTRVTAILKIIDGE